MTDEEIVNVVKENETLYNEVLNKYCNNSSSNNNVGGGVIISINSEKNNSKYIINGTLNENISKFNINTWNYFYNINLGYNVLRTEQSELLQNNNIDTCTQLCLWNKGSHCVTTRKKTEYSISGGFDLRNQNGNYSNPTFRPVYQIV